jgi:hypothetical protein
MRRAPHRTVTRLAFLAMALLCLMPTVGRLTAAAHAAHATLATHATPAAAHAMPARLVAAATPAHDHHAMAMHDHQAMQARAAVQGGEAPAPSAPGNEHERHGGGDCDYCPLLASLLTQAVFVAPPRVLHTEANAPPFQAAGLRPAAMVPSLGSRGPPGAA